MQTEDFAGFHQSLEAYYAIAGHDRFPPYYFQLMILYSFYKFGSIIA
jgi:hypothetical protein